MERAEPDRRWKRCTSLRVGSFRPWTGSRDGRSSCSATASRTTALAGLETLVEATFTRNRGRLLDCADVDLDKLRLLLRLSKELGYLDARCPSRADSADGRRHFFPSVSRRMGARPRGWRSFRVLALAGRRGGPYVVVAIGEPESGRGGGENERDDSICSTRHRGCIRHPSGVASCGAVGRGARWRGGAGRMRARRHEAPIGDAARGRGAQPRAAVLRRVVSDHGAAAPAWGRGRVCADDGHRGVRAPVPASTRRGRWWRWWRTCRWRRGCRRRFRCRVERTGCGRVRRRGPSGCCFW